MQFFINIMPFIKHQLPLKLPYLSDLLVFMKMKEK